ncbi:MAG: acetyltransferase [SAR324 cluster bacterium]|nr:acetyltransferase [SAR324 cluster bacterium]MBL7034371.1 acetyltransferase [SAR324 cluster bacterium]
MSYIDIFNGDADGICALHQLRLQDPQKSRLVTGVKRDTLLLKQVISVKDCLLTVLDISSHSNRDSLQKLLKQGNTVHYFDHHFAGKIPESTNFLPHIDTSPDVCTSILVDRFLAGKYRLWAVVAAFGDNLHSAANVLAGSLKLSPNETENLREMGELINYNAYGETIADLFFSPEALYRSLQPFSDPFEYFLAAEELGRLRQGFRNDMQLAEKILPVKKTPAGKIYQFPDAAWCRRVSGVFSNQIARQEPDLAHALLVERKNGSFLVGVRAPLARPLGAEKLCIKFNGGGRAAAAGINNLAPEEVDRFLEAFELQYAG